MRAEIRSMKEEEYQDGFLNNLFVNALGHTLRQKKKVKLSLEEEAEWMQYFNKKKAEANAL